MVPAPRPQTALPTEVNAPAHFHHYLPITETIFDGGVFVTSVGAGRVDAGAPYPLPGHPSLYHFNWKDGRTLPEFSLMLITAGKGLFESRSTGAVSVAAGVVIMICPGVWHRYRPEPTTGWTEKWMHFNGELAHRLLAHGVFSLRQPVWRPNDFSLVEAALDRLLLVVQRRPAENSLQVSLLGLALLSAALAEDAAVAGPAVEPPTPIGQTPSLTDPLVQRAVDHIWTQGHKELAVAHVAAATGVNRRKLERHFRAALGRGVLDEIINCRYSRAERLVRETDLPLKSIVGLAGFGGMENMRRVFLTRAGHSPAAHRQSLRKG